ncbi:hypothetical protein [Planctomicrobium sp. SH664]|uniref:hypothetical protein n=1 Tax=Planctomicrobium sp. SH664 TaxID=3448125 RepID=UPI003F5C14FC
MEEFLLGYQVNPPTWFYLSTLLILAVYFRFTRFLSLRNVDLVLLLSASPGLIFVNSQSSGTQSIGHAWLFVMACLFLVRLFVDPFLSRRPYLGQNLNSQGMGFLCVAAFAFLTAQAITSSLPKATQDTLERGANIVNRTPESPDPQNQPSAGPAAAVIAASVNFVFEDLAARILAILAHAAVITGLWFVGRNLFADKSLGLAMATLYLLLPCTAYNVGQFNHVLPAALIVWAFVCFRKPVVSGVLLGLACGTTTFPVFLLPIWANYYGRRQALRFVMALCGVAIALLLSIAMTSTDSNSFLQRTIGSLNLALAAFSGVQVNTGFWGDMNYLSVYRLPVIVAYFVMLFVMALWPKVKTLEVLLAWSTAAVVGTQLWYPQEGGVYVLWYLPLLLMVMFRPRLVQLASSSTPGDLSEASSISTGKSGQHPLMTRTSANRNLQMYR